MKKVSLQFWVMPDLYKRFREYCKKNDISGAALMRQLIKDCLEKEEKKLAEG